MPANNSVSGSFTGTGRSASFRGDPKANVIVAGTFVASVQLEKSLDGGQTWAPIKILGSQYYVWTAPAAEQIEEFSSAAFYSFNCTSFTSGTVSYGAGL